MSASPSDWAEAWGDLEEPELEPEPFPAHVWEDPFLPEDEFPEPVGDCGDDLP